MARWQNATVPEEDNEDCETGSGLIVSVIAMVVLFFLIMGLAGSVDVETLRGQFRRRFGIICGLCCQFILMPFVGFFIISTSQPPRHVGLVIMILVSSPGGAYSNWWCSLFNADLALSVAMTAVSTVVCAGMLPLNLTIYVNLLYGQMVDIPWRTLIESVAIVFSAITAGIIISTTRPKWKTKMQLLGNCCGVMLMAMSLGASIFSKKKDESGQEQGSPLWAKPGWFYCVVGAPFFLSLLASLLVSSLSCFQLERPERLAITIEASYQNVGIAAAVAMSAFCGSPGEQSDAVAIPVLYGSLEAIALGIFCLIGWKAGWTYAPPKTPFVDVIRKDFQPSVEEVLRRSLGSASSNESKGIGDVGDLDALSVRSGSASQAEASTPEAAQEPQTTSFGKAGLQAEPVSRGEMGSLPHRWPTSPGRPLPPGALRPGSPQAPEAVPPGPFGGRGRHPEKE